MKCCYCDCTQESSGIINGNNFCTHHLQRLKEVKITNRKLGHDSKYSPEAESDFDTIDEMKLRKGRIYNKNEFELND